MGLTEPTKSRLEAFSDGVIAIIITLMVLEIHRPSLSGDSIADQSALAALGPHLISYLLSFVVIGILWLNHHQVFHLVRAVDAKVLWLNLNLLFWMSLIPLPTGLLGTHPLLPLVNAFYGLILFSSSASYACLRRAVNRRMYDSVSEQDKQRANRKNAISAGLYLLSVPCAFLSVYLSWFVFLLVPILHFIPEKADACVPPPGH